MKNKLYLATAIVNFMVCGAYIAMGQHVLVSGWWNLALFVEQEGLI